MREHERWFAGAHEGVPGFLTAIAADALSGLLSFQLDQGVAGALVEIGTYMGKTFAGLAKAARPDERAVGFDLFPPPVEVGFRRMLAELAPEERARAVGLRRDTGAVAAAEWIALLGAPARFVHIDGGHGREAVLADARLALSHLAPRALVVFDDFLHDWYPELTEGILDALRAAPQLVPVAVVPRVGPPQGGGTKLVCATRDGAAACFDFLATRFADQAPAVRPFMNARVMTWHGVKGVEARAGIEPACKDLQSSA